MSRACTDCGGPITAQSKTGRCRPCCARGLGHDAASRRKAAQTHKERNLSDPAYRRRHRESVSSAIRRKIRTDPEYAENRREMGRKLRATGMCSPHLAAGSPSRVRAGDKIREIKMGWCPPAYRAEYAALMRKWRMTKDKARKIMLERIPLFEMQLWRVQAGASISLKPVIPSKSYDFTLGGGSPL